MTATPALSSGLVGQAQKRISDMLFLDKKDSEFVHDVLTELARGLLREMEIYAVEKEREEDMDPGDVSGYRGLS